MRRALLIVLGVLALCGAVVAAATLGMVAIPGLRAHARAAPPAVSEAVPVITTNLADDSGDHFAEVGLTVSVVGPGAARRFEEDLPAIQDAVISAIHARSYAQVSTADGLTQLRAAISASVGAVLGGSSAVQAVYFTQFLIQ